MPNLKRMNVTELLALHVQIGEELRDRDIVRSANNPTGDLAEYLFCKAFGWKQAPSSMRGYDATGDDGLRYEIKGRRIHRRSNSRQLSAIRDISGGHFDVLAGVLFGENYTVKRAALIPRDIVEENSRYQRHTNSHLFFLREEIWKLDGVLDVTINMSNAMP